MKQLIYIIILAPCAVVLLSVLVVCAVVYFTFSLVFNTFFGSLKIIPKKIKAKKTQEKKVVLTSFEKDFKRLQDAFSAN